MCYYTNEATIKFSGFCDKGLTSFTFSGINNVMKRLPWTSGDSILYNNWTYGAIQNAIDDVLAANTGKILKVWVCLLTKFSSCLVSVQYFMGSSLVARMWLSPVCRGTLGLNYRIYCVVKNTTNNVLAVHNHKTWGRWVLECFCCCYNLLVVVTMLNSKLLLLLFSKSKQA